jgi:hypothetical protein
MSRRLVNWNWKLVGSVGNNVFSFYLTHYNIISSPVAKRLTPSSRLAEMLSLKSKTPSPTATLRKPISSLKEKKPPALPVIHKVHSSYSLFPQRLQALPSLNTTRPTNSTCKRRLKTNEFCPHGVPTLPSWAYNPSPT